MPHWSRRLANNISRRVSRSPLGPASPTPGCARPRAHRAAAMMSSCKRGSSLRGSIRKASCASSSTLGRALQQRGVSAIAQHGRQREQALIDDRCASALVSTSAVSSDSVPSGSSSLTLPRVAVLMSALMRASERRRCRAGSPALSRQPSYAARKSERSSWPRHASSSRSPARAYRAWSRAGESSSGMHYV